MQSGLPVELIGRLFHDSKDAAGIIHTLRFKQDLDLMHGQFDGIRDLDVALRRDLEQTVSIVRRRRALTEG